VVACGAAEFALGGELTGAAGAWPHAFDIGAVLAKHRNNSQRHPGLAEDLMKSLRILDASGPSRGSRNLPMELRFTALCLQKNLDSPQENPA
jgi:hypothetical protein